ncbi:glycosyltransferase [Mariniflexile sp. HMF6888]|uniref:glycosyltransferase n=1 Tax=Mariniflexile sp. HMF6888 TaxID=3373086 RepID=UPI00379FBA7A
MKDLKPLKILFISMNSIHAIRWIENLDRKDYEIYWFDVLNRGKLEKLSFATQFYGMNKRKIPYLKGEYFLYKKLPFLYNYIIKYLEVTPNEALDKIIKEIQPDIVHSFEMQSCSYPILKTMQKYSEMKWVYSCWGSDLYYYKDFKEHRYRLRNVLKRVDYLLADCNRDFEIAKEIGFKGRFLGVIPGGGGYHLEDILSYKYAIANRKLILIKGYQHTFGRALNVLKAIEDIYLHYPDFEFVVFGAHNETISYIEEKKMPFKVYQRNELSHIELLKLMGKSLVYIGNSISDGIPNTLLEAIVMGAFPIQTNPGNATSEIIQDGINGLLIQDAENIEEIKLKIIKALDNGSLINQARIYNDNLALERLDYQKNRIRINAFYNTIMKCE